MARKRPPAGRLFSFYKRCRKFILRQVDELAAICGRVWKATPSVGRVFHVVCLLVVYAVITCVLVKGVLPTGREPHRKGNHARLPPDDNLRVKSLYFYIGDTYSKVIWFVKVGKCSRIRCGARVRGKGRGKPKNKKCVKGKQGQNKCETEDQKSGESPALPDTHTSLRGTTQPDRRKTAKRSDLNAKPNQDTEPDTLNNGRQARCLATGTRKQNGQPKVDSGKKLKQLFAKFRPLSSACQPVHASVTAATPQKQRSPPQHKDIDQATPKCADKGPFKDYPISNHDKSDGTGEGLHLRELRVYTNRENGACATTPLQPIYESEQETSEITHTKPSHPKEAASNSPPTRRILVARRNTIDKTPNKAKEANPCRRNEPTVPPGFERKILVPQRNVNDQTPDEAKEVNPCRRNEPTVPPGFERKILVAQRNVNDQTPDEAKEVNPCRKIEPTVPPGFERKILVARRNGSESSTQPENQPPRIIHRRRPKLGIKALNTARITDLTFVTTLGEGSFGRVELVHLTGNPHKTYALKCLKKIRYPTPREQAAIFRERDMLMAADSPFIARIYRTFKDAKYLYLLIEACLGGDVETLLQTRRVLDEDTCKFCAACALEGLTYLHNKGIVYRDLKPENLIFNSAGYVKLIDLGFAKKIGAGNKTYSFCGTPEYMAPEVILKSGQDLTVDQWALGVLIFEFLTGSTPFMQGATEIPEVFKNVLRGVGAVTFPADMEPSAQHLVTQLCQIRPQDRLGSGHFGIGLVRSHRWFVGFDWEALQTETMVPPIIPTVRNATDTSNFHVRSGKRNMPPDDLSGWDEHF